MTDRPDRPVVSGLLALVAAAVALGLLLGLGFVVLGRGVTDGGSKAGGGPSMYLPEPTDTGTPSHSDQQPSGTEQPGGGRTGGSHTGQPATAIVLKAGQGRVGAMQQIDLSGDYPGGDGAILQVQRFESGHWADFPVTASVSGGSFSTYVQTGHTGPNKFRVIDTDSGKKSNAVTVTVG